jgi:hypothetical protein
MHWVLALLLTVSPFLVDAQSARTDFEKAVSDWNQLRSMRSAVGEVASFSKGKEQADQVYESTIRTLDQLNKADSLQPFIQLVRWSAGSDYAVLLDQFGKSEDAFQVRTALLESSQQLLKQDFPIEYQGDTKYFIVQRFDFEQEVNQFIAELGYAYYSKNDLLNALPLLKEADEMGKLDPKMAARNSMILFNSLLTQNLAPDTHLLRVALQLFQDWNSLDQAARATLNQGDNLTEKCVEVIERALMEHPEWSEQGALWAKSSRLLATVNKEDKSVAFASQAIKAGYQEREFLLSLFPMALRVGDNATARLAVDQLASQLLPDQCDFHQMVAVNYQKMGEDELFRRYQKRAEACQQQANKTQHRQEREGGLYLGSYVFPWFRTDWGAVAGIQTRKWYLEFSYQELSDRRDKLYDIRFRGVDGSADQKVRWDGYYTHVAINRTSGKKGARTYSGLLFGYNQRNYQRMLVQTILDETGAVVNTWGPEEFRPKEERYILMLNSGAHFNGRFLASNTYFSFGGAWNRFDKGSGSAFVERSKYEYLGNPLLNGRRANRFALMARIGITIGFQVGPRTFQPKKSETKIRY